MGYDQTAWSGFAATLGAIAGALTGLLFVALSIKSDLLSCSRNLSSRAAQSLCLFMSAVLIALIVVAPQPRVALGVELLLLAGTTAVGMLILGRRAGHATATSGTTRYLEQWAPNLITPLLIGLGGVTLLVHAGGGLYWLLAAAVAGLLGGVVSAWLFLVKMTA
jgi:hypothetical protein